MSQDKTNVLDTDVIIFPMPHREASRGKSIEDTDGGFETEKEPSSTIRKEKFARLRRSLRKKSVSIL